MLTYTAARGIAAEWLSVVVLTALVVLVAVRYAATRGSDGRAQWLAIVASVGAFALWIVTLGDPLFGWTPPWPSQVSVGIATAYVAVISIWYRGDPA